MQTINIKRSEAEKILGEVRRLLAETALPEAERLAAIRRVFEGSPYEGARGSLPTIPGLTPCPGEAHSNGYIDNCSVCRGVTWGLVGPVVKVR